MDANFSDVRVWTMRVFKGKFRARCDESESVEQQMRAVGQ